MSKKHNEDLSEPLQESLRQIALVPCKLIILYMLDLSGEPLTRARVGDFILDGDHANYLTLQTAFEEMLEGGFLEQRTQDNRTFLSITQTGRDAIYYYKNRLHEDTRESVKDFLKSEGSSIRDEAAVKIGIRKLTEGGYMAELSIKEGNKELLGLSISAPTEDIADDITNNWKEKYKDIYKYILSELLI